MELKKGDVVRLKSGGPKMTIKFIEGETVACVWFNEKNQKQEAAFEAEMLEKSDKDRTAGISLVRG
nr:DUF2158 domain-containing protein [Nitrosomonas nitrosa]